MSISGAGGRVLCRVVAISLLTAGCSPPQPQHPFSAWEPGDSRQEALLQGELAILNGCLSIDNIAIAIPNAAVWDADAETLTLDGNTVQLGESVSAGGGTHTVEDSSPCEAVFFAHSLR